MRKRKCRARRSIADFFKKKSFLYTIPCHNFKVAMHLFWVYPALLSNSLDGTHWELRGIWVKMTVCLENKRSSNPHTHHTPIRRPTSDRATSLLFQVMFILFKNFKMTLARVISQSFFERVFFTFRRNRDHH